MKTTKNCQICGTKNLKEAKFCGNCGTEIFEYANRKGECSFCNTMNEKGARFCSDCGHLLSPGSDTEQKKRVKNSRNIKNKRRAVKNSSNMYFNLFMGVFVIALLYLFLNDNSSTEKRKNTIQKIVEEKSGNPKIEKAVLNIASKFICSCGTCGEQPLDICTCETAKHQRNYIRQALVNGQINDDIILAVNNKFGWIKSEFKEKYGEGKPIINPTSLTNLNLSSNGILNVGDKSKQRIANPEDRLYIFSRFSCPCGQCEIPELKDCNCNHVRGAQEVKKFVDKKIAENTFAVNNIILMVEENYGNRIR